MVAPDPEDRPTLEEVEENFNNLMLEYELDPLKVVAKGIIDANEEKYL